MKKIIATLLVCSVIGFTANAQEQKKDASMPQMTKEQKEAMKHQREAEMNDAMTAAGLTDAQKAESKEAFEAANKAKNELKKDATLTDAQKLEKKKAIDEEQKTKLIKIMGEDKLKKFKDFQKKAKELKESKEKASPAKGYK